ncbi:MAG: ABC transporter ATP-binding protein [Bacteriovoracia bacterium]
MSNQIALSIQGLRTGFYSEGKILVAVDGVDLTLTKGRTLGVVGESGCGKSVTALSVLRLISPASGKILGGKILFEGKDLLGLPETDLREIRGNKISMIFQEPMTSLNPVLTVGDQIQEVFRVHQTVTKKEAQSRSIEMLKLVGIPSAEERYHYYPHQLSGGMRQRVMIAIALACQPAVLIADEPTTALDVTIQAQILELLKSLQQKLGMAILLITHDLGVVAENADEVAVMYAGRVVESGAVREVFSHPRHPYTIGLLDSIPKGKGRLTPIQGVVPSLDQLPAGCRFEPRCPHRRAECKTVDPTPRQIGTQKVACLVDL